MAWFKKARKPIVPTTDKASRVPEGLWVKCPGCAQIIYNKDLAVNLNVCPKCAHHFRVNATERLRMLFDGESWVEHDPGLVSTDPLRFADTKPYKARLKAGFAATGSRDAVIIGSGTIDGIATVVAATRNPAWRRSAEHKTTVTNTATPNTTRLCPKKAANGIATAAPMAVAATRTQDSLIAAPKLACKTIMAVMAAQ